MAARAIWKGSISFGLVNIPVGLFSASSPDELSFSMLDRRDMSPIGYKKVNKATGEDVPKEDIVKGYKFGPDRFVTVEDADFKRASPEKTQRIDIVRFVDLGRIAPAYFERPYYLEPDPKAEKAYAILREAMRRSGKIGVATVVLRAKQYLAALIPQGRIMTLELLRYPDELRDPGELRAPEEDVSRLQVREEELKMAQRLIDELAGPWKPQDFRDEYRDELLAFIERKAKEGKVETAPAPEAAATAPPPADIMELLKRSLEQRGEAGRGGVRAHVH